MLIKRGVSLAVVAEALGHKGTRMVERHYGHLAPTHVAESIAEKLPRFDIEIDSEVKLLRA